MKETDKFYLGIQEPHSSCLLALRNIILQQDQNISETIKWNLPCFSYKKKMFCFLSINRKTDEPYLLIVEGRLTDHPLLEAADRKRMKSISFNPEEDLPLDAITEILNSALDLYRNGIIKVK